MKSDTDEEFSILFIDDCCSFSEFEQTVSVLATVRVDRRLTVKGRVVPLNSESKACNAIPVPIPDEPLSR